MSTKNNTADATALARKLARKECNAKFAILERAEIEHRAALALTDNRVSWDDLRDFRARQKITGAAWLEARRAWFVAVADYCAADYEYTKELFEIAKSEIRANDNEDTRKAYGKAIRANRAAAKREQKAKLAAAAAAKASA